ncbi:hypothetical protein T265_10459 [Opisthorchis viverrini]|uniref:TIL domain-containing protein n=1 Tax=Opisthorchis viverrini TaxID=6198 RepID=A0A075A1A7_OPIVI|nr:hypothetical protein T265_10459 [Opisthorchis viverrini]KER21149.1 hypothetical protein T265_10459 [Opisthorchis viverrini]
MCGNIRISKVWFMVLLTLSIPLSPTCRGSVKTEKSSCSEECSHTAAKCETDCGPSYPVMNSECVSGCRIAGLFCEDRCQLKKES